VLCDEWLDRSIVTRAHVPRHQVYDAAAKALSFAPRFAGAASVTLPFACGEAWGTFAQVREPACICLHMPCKLACLHVPSEMLVYTSIPCKLAHALRVKPSLSKSQSTASRRGP
jgi:hypothetical protein